MKAPRASYQKRGISRSTIYSVQYRHVGNLRQVRQSLQLIRENWADEKQHFRFWDKCPGPAAPNLTVEEFAMCFLLQRHEKRYRKTKLHAANIMCDIAGREGEEGD